MPALLSVNGLVKSFDGGATFALGGVSFDVQAGESLAVLGPSGCGKSTLLRLIAGLDTPDSGDVLLEGASLRGVPAHRRGFGLMHQDLALFPHLSVFENVAFGLRSRRQPAHEVTRRVTELLELMQISGFGPRRVETLSGGEQQRVALARSLAPRPRLLMLDEPLGALDRNLRAELGWEIRRIRDETQVTTLYVTHDQDEAFTIADRVLLMARGQAVQLGTPEEVFLRPASPFAARFLGHANLARCVVTRNGDGSAQVDTPLASWRLDAGAEPLPPPGHCTALIPPEAVTFGAPDDGGVPGVVRDVLLQGGRYHVSVECAGGRYQADVPLGPSEPTRPVVGSRVTVRVDTNRIRLLPWLEDGTKPEDIAEV